MATSLAERLHQDVAFRRVNRGGHPSPPGVIAGEQITPDSLIALLRKVRIGDPNVQFVSLERKRLPTAYLKALLEAVSTSKYVTKLKISRVGAGDEVAEAVAKCLRMCHSLTELDLSKNNLTDTGCSKLAGAFQETGNKCRIRRLNLEGNQIGDNGISALCEAIPITNVAYLKLGKNRFSADGIGSIMTLLQKDETPLTSLDLRANGLGNDGASLLAAAVEKNEILQALCLSHNGIDNAGVRHLAEALSRNEHLQTLDLQDNLFDDEGAEYLTKCLENNDSFKKLKLRNNSVSNEVKQKLLDLLLVNSHGPDLAKKTKRAMTSLVEDFSESSFNSAFDAEEEESTECVICFENISGCALLPCKHHNCCTDCASKLKHCHMCRETVVKVVPINPTKATAIEYST
jgi:Ran GTPase-activating protein (RanGAP) involved in mRNA processing and transport